MMYMYKWEDENGKQGIAVSEDKELLEELEEKYGEEYSTSVEGVGKVNKDVLFLRCNDGNITPFREVK